MRRSILIACLLQIMLAMGNAQTATKTASRPVLICFGDSLTEGFGVKPGEAFPSLLQREFDAKSLGYRIVNFGLSGDTTAGGLDRLPQVLAQTRRRTAGTRRQ